MEQKCALLLDENDNIKYDESTTLSEHSPQIIS